MRNSKRYLLSLLSFKDKASNNQYFLENNEFQISCFKTLITTLIVLSGYPILLSHNYENIVKNKVLPIICILLGFSFYCFIVLRFFRKYIELSICFIVSVVVIYPLEFVNFSTLREGTMLFLGSGIQMIIIFPIVLRVSWRRSSLLILLLQGYLFIRKFSYETMQTMNMYPIVGFAIHSTILISLHYSSEKQSRKSFHERIVHERTLEIFKTVLTDMIPNAAIVVKGREIIFSNKATHQLLPHHSNADLKSKLNKIHVKYSEVRDENHNLITDMELMENSKSKPEISDGYIRLKDLLKYHIITDNFNISTNFSFYHGFISSEPNEISRLTNKALDIQIG